jgi:hypothetical protein
VALPSEQFFEIVPRHPILVMQYTYIMTMPITSRSLQPALACK